MEERYLLSTEDGSSTLYLEEYGQAMHSMSGAYQESLLKHILPSRILQNDGSCLYALDIGFGLGYNVLALIYEYIIQKKTGHLEIISLEKERNFIDFMSNIKFSDQRDDIYSFIKDVYISGNGYINNINLKIIFGDARETLKNLSGIKFNAIFQDPFSPSKNPELWSRDYFNLLKNLLSETGIITTYSSAVHIRRAMIEAGLLIGRGPSVGKKREGTIASFSDIITELSKEDKQNLFSDIKSEPYEDPFFNLSREEILQSRSIRIKSSKRKSDNIVQFCE